MSFSQERDLQWILKIEALPSKSGNPISTFLYILQGLVRAGSSVSGLLVAMITLIFP